MLLGALLDAGADGGDPRGLGGLGVDGLELRTERAEPARRSPATRVTVAGAAEQPHRDWRSIRALIDAAGLPERARDARAGGVPAARPSPRARIHGIDPEHVHFHEVGAVDAIGEVVRRRARARGAAASTASSARRCRSAAGSSRPPTGACRCPRRRRSSCSRARRSHGVEVEMELVTPTGAALVAALADALRPAARR